MIVKTGSTPYKLYGLEALKRRLSPNRSKEMEIEEKIRITIAGINGEKTLEAIFNKYKLNFEHAIYHGLNLSSTGKFQIDNLFLSRQGAFILEVKNIKGHIRFSEETKQLKRTLDTGQIDAFECPSVQLERNRYLLEDWFHSRSYSIPIHTAVVFPNPRQLIENTRPHLNILFPNEVPSMLRIRESNSPVIDLKTFTSIAKELLDAHKEYNPYPMCNSYKINPDEIRSGVHCDKCGTLGMQRIVRGWGCNVCRHVSKNAHVHAITDWFMLVSEKMTNRDCREFLHIPNNYTASRLLRDLPLEPDGVNKGRFYRFPLERMK
jgi:hypothetical protein